MSTFLRYLRADLGRAPISGTLMLLLTVLMLYRLCTGDESGAERALTLVLVISLTRDSPRVPSRPLAKPLTPDQEALRRAGW